MRYAKASIRQWFARATEAQKREGFGWYPQAYATAQAMSAEYGVSTRQCAGVIAALSPRNRWHKNVEYAYALLDYATGRRDDVPFCGLAGNRAKALRILAGEPASDVLSGQKVTAFFANILGDTDAVTVDVWAARACGHKSDKLNTTQYRNAAKAYRDVAAEVGVSPRDLQAIVWVVIREEY